MPWRSWGTCTCNIARGNSALRPGGRLALAGYALAALAVSIWAMRSQSMEWTLIVTAVVVPLLIVATLYRRLLHTAW